MGLDAPPLWDHAGSRTEPVSPALAGEFFTIEPPGMSLVFAFKLEQNILF